MPINNDARDLGLFLNEAGVISYWDGVADQPVPPLIPTSVVQTTVSETIYMMRYAGGSLANPTAPSATTILGRIYFQAWDTAAYATASTVVGEALGQWSPSDHYGGLAFQCIPQGTTAVTTMARLSGWRFYVVQNANDTIGPSLAMSKSRGNIGTPLYPQISDILGNMEWRGYDESAGGYQVQASIYSTAPASWGVGDRSAQMVFNTTAIGATTLTARWQIMHNGHLRPFVDATYDIGSATAAVNNLYAYTINAGSSTRAAQTDLLIVAAAGQFRQMQFVSGSLSRWFFGADNTAEGGSDAGSNLYIKARTDAGAAIDSPITITRAAGGAITFARPAVTVASATARAGLNLPHGAAPTSPVNGDMWTTTAGLFVRINGTTVGPLT